MTDRYLLDNFKHEELFSLAGFDISNGHVHNPLRHDSNPGCFYEEFKNDLYFYDFTYYFGKAGINAVDALKHKTGIEDNELLFKYIKDNISKVDVKILPPVNTEIKIEIESKPFEKVNYFSKYLIPRKALEIEEVLNIKSYKCNTKKDVNVRVNRFGSPSTTPMIAYKFENRHKIYNPYGLVKWYGNITANDIYGYNTFDRNSEYVIVTKSGKDFLVVKYVLGFECVAVQGEGMFFTEKLLNILDGKKVIVIFDNDEAGVRAMKRLKEERGYDYLIPPKLIDKWNRSLCTDVSDNIYFKGLNYTKSIFEKLKNVNKNGTSRRF